MLKRVKYALVLLMVITTSINAQTIENLKAINQVWADFYMAFDSLDISYMEKIHAKNLMRIPGGNRILDYDTYMNNYSLQFENDKATNQTSAIELRFFERLNNETTASERGIYKMTRNRGTENERIFYGKFHVLFRKTDGKWKITMDYDNNESNTIGESDFENAFAIDYFEPFISN